MKPIEPIILKTCWAFGIYIFVKPLTGSKVCLEVLKDNVLRAGTKIFNQTNKTEYNEMNNKISQLYHDYFNKILQKFNKKTINQKLKDYDRQ